MASGVLVGLAEGWCHSPLSGNNCRISGEAKPDNPDMRYLEADSNCLVGLARLHSYQVRTRHHCQMRRCARAVLPYHFVLCIRKPRYEQGRLRMIVGGVHSYLPLFCFGGMSSAQRKSKRIRRWIKAVMSKAFATTYNSILRLSLSEDANLQIDLFRV